MDLKCKNRDAWGQFHWAAGYQIQIGLDGYARNVPDDAARKMLANRDVWEAPKGSTPPPPPGLLRPFTNASAPVQTFAPPPPAPPPAPEVIKVEVCLTPDALGILENLEPPQVLTIARAFEIDLATLEDPSRAGVARAVLRAADAQLAAELRRILDAVQPIAPSVTETPASQAEAEIPAPAAAPVVASEPPAEAASKKAKPKKSVAAVPAESTNDDLVG